MTELKSKRILYITHVYNSFEKDQIEAIASSFLEVYVIVRYKPIAEISRLLPISALKIHRKEHSINLQNLPHNVKVFASPVWYMPGQNYYHLVGDKHLQAVEEVIQKNKLEFDIIHAHFLWSAGYVAVKLKEKYQKKCIITGHGEDVYIYPFLDIKWQKRIEAVVNNSDIVLTVSKSNAEYLERLSINKKIHVIPNGYNEKIFFKTDKNLERKKLGLPIDKTIFLSIGYFSAIKGHRFLIDAFRKLVIKQKDVLLIMIGSGSLEKDLKQQVKNFNLESKVMFAGQLKHEKLNEWINSSDIFILPSLRESFGVVQIEAMACGKPIVATRNGGSEEIVISEEFGLLAQTENSDDLLNQMENAINKEWNAEKIENYAKEYSWAKIIKSIEVFYERLSKK
jgi:glycosyltransferase involved in cell wall biosynthesis